MHLAPGSDPVGSALVLGWPQLWGPGWLHTVNATSHCGRVLGGAARAGAAEGAGCLPGALGRASRKAPVPGACPDPLQVRSSSDGEDVATSSEAVLGWLLA